MGKFQQGLAEELSLYARQLAWLHATPEPPKGFKGEPDRRSRMQRQKDAGRAPDLPDVSAPHVVAYWMEVGPAAAAGMGPAPLSHTELRAWQDNTGIELTPWEARLVRTLSREYVSELHAAEKVDRQAPYMPLSPEQRAAAVAQDMRAALVRMAKG